MLSFGSFYIIFVKKGDNGEWWIWDLIQVDNVHLDQTVVNSIENQLQSQADVGEMPKKLAQNIDKGFDRERD